MADVSTLSVAGGWQNIFQGTAKMDLEGFLPAYITPRRWFGAKARTLQTVAVVEAIPITNTASLTLLRVSYTEGEPEIYQLPLAFTTGAAADTLKRDRPQAVVTHLQTEAGVGILYDAVWDDGFGDALLKTIAGQHTLTGLTGQLSASTTQRFSHLRGPATEDLSPALLGAEQSNTSIRYGDRLILKLFRRLETGTNPDLEIGHFLTEKSAFAHIPGVAGALTYHPIDAPEPVTLAILQGFVPNQGDAWHYTLQVLASYLEQGLSDAEITPEALALPSQSLLDLAHQDIPPLVPQLIGDYLASAQLLGQRTAELHLALASDPADPNFAPESFSEPYQHLLHQRMGSLTKHVLQLLRLRLQKLPEAARTEAQQVLEAETAILHRFQPFLEQKITALRTRIHGDYHLGQVLYTGQDFMIIDFEGEPARTLAERRLKRSPWQDVAGMLRSFHYAAYAALFERLEAKTVQAEEKTKLEAWVCFWHLWVSVAFLKTYLVVTDGAAFRAKSPGERQILLDAYLLEKAIYELGYELNNRPAWVKIPLQGILQTLRAEG